MIPENNFTLIHSKKNQEILILFKFELISIFNILSYFQKTYFCRAISHMEIWKIIIPKMCDKNF